MGPVGRPGDRVPRDDRRTRNYWCRHGTELGQRRRRRTQSVGVDDASVGRSSEFKPRRRRRPPSSPAQRWAMSYPPHESPMSILHHQPAIPKSESALKRWLFSCV
jgi:hypothetical protein